MGPILPPPVELPVVSGSWNGFYNDGVETVRFAVGLAQKGKKLSGTITFYFSNKTERGTVSGSVEASGKVYFMWRRPPQNIISRSFTGSFKKGGSSISGTCSSSDARRGTFRIVK